MLTVPMGRRARAVSGLLAPALVLCALLLRSCGPVIAAGASAGPTVREVVEFTRIVQPRDHDADALRTQVSPNGRQAFIVVRSADVRSDRNRFEILLLDTRPDHLAAGRTRAPEQLLLVESTQDNNFSNPSIQDARWLDDRTIVFRGRVHDAPFQVHKLDVPTRRLTQLTFEKQRIVSYAVSSDLRRVVYAMLVPNPPLAPGARSVVVGSQSFWSVKHGQDDLRAQQRRYQYAVADAGSHRPARLLGTPFSETGGYPPGVDISPDGRWALLHRWEPGRQRAWAQHYPLLAEAIAKFGPAFEVDPLGYFSRPSGYVARRLVAYRLADGAEQAVTDAPDDSMPGIGQVRTDRLWMGGGRSVVIAGTHLPLQASTAGGRGSASHLVEYWPELGRWSVIATLGGRLQAAFPLPGASDGFIAIDDGKRRRFQRRADRSWQEVDQDSGSAETATAESANPWHWTLRIDETLNQPPDVVAAGPAGRLVKLTDLNPQFSAATWGTMRPYAWNDAKGRRWDGGLMVPAGFDPRARRALVIQTYGFTESRFYLDGSNQSNGFTSGFPGRALLREDILVLAFPLRASSGAPHGERAGAEAFADGIRGAIDALVDEGLVDRDRIGLMGWSATGESVLNLVTFSDAPIRAATVLDGDANTLFSMTITYGAQDSMLARKEEVNEGGPFGEARDRWVRNDPSLHTDCVEAALRIETYGPWVLNNWDVYALLRRQYKPVEMVVIPGGSHALSRPGERMVSLQGNVDWYRFWLKDEERSGRALPAETDEDLKAQYARWRQMADFKRANDAKPRCARMVGGG